jgi:hypothetical protein
VKLRRLEQWVTDFQRFGKTNMDFAALQQKLFDLDPSDRAEDLRRLSESVGGMPQESVQTEENFLQESVEVQEGTMPVEGDYSLSDFAALAGVTLNEGVKDAYKAGYDNYNSLSAISGGVKAGIKPNKDSPVKPNKNTFKKDDHSWKGFLQQHTAQLQKIAANPKQKAAFDQFMAKMGEGVEEARSSASDQAAAAGAYNGGKSISKQNKKSKPMKRSQADRDAGVARMRDEDEAAKKAQRDRFAAMKNESIKEMLYRKLNAKK